MLKKVVRSVLATTFLVVMFVGCNGAEIPGISQIPGVDENVAVGAPVDAFDNYCDIYARISRSDYTMQSHADYLQYIDVMFRMDHPLEVASDNQLNKAAAGITAAQKVLDVPTVYNPLISLVAYNAVYAAVGDDNNGDYVMNNDYNNFRNEYNNTRVLPLSVTEVAKAVVSLTEKRNLLISKAAFTSAKAAALADLKTVRWVNTEASVEARKNAINAVFDPNTNAKSVTDAIEAINKAVNDNVLIAKTGAATEEWKAYGVAREAFEKLQSIDYTQLTWDAANHHKPLLDDADSITVNKTTNCYLSDMLNLIRANTDNSFTNYKSQILFKRFQFGNIATNSSWAAYQKKISNINNLTRANLNSELNNACQIISSAKNNLENIPLR